MTTLETLLQRLQLQPLPTEGGHFARVWTSQDQREGRPAGTSIYFLLTPDGFSALHRVDADEGWHFHAGDAVEHWQLRPDGHITRTVLGTEFDDGDVPQVWIPAGTWQGARLAPQRQTLGWSLVGCTMIPGWNEVGFELAPRAIAEKVRLPHRSEVLALVR